ncbi:hypothetical protein YYC_04982 [Plasmodium yoelii 17X]|uniref:Uncharacterized protein n=1 Tax=Plasmodium yoelii 17X TaxID=1323249 RepID=V7PCM4_PLAYE|nr:hypothetical protein YYC_04982 [Plasmodium yoelii 17X]
MRETTKCHEPITYKRKIISNSTIRSPFILGVLEEGIPSLATIFLNFGYTISSILTLISRLSKDFTTNWNPVNALSREGLGFRDVILTKVEKGEKSSSKAEENEK